MLKEFKEFIMRGNVLDLAIAVIIGGAFGAIVTSAVNDVVMPPIGLVLGHVDFKDLFLALNGQSYPTLAAAKAAAAPVLAYGQFLNTVVNFLIIAAVVFLVVKQANRYKKPIIVVETAYDWRDGETYKQGKPPFPETPEGQAEFLAAVIRTVQQTPNGLGRGVFWWEPMAAGAIAKRGMFDDQHNALPVLRVTDPAAPPIH